MAQLFETPSRNLDQRMMFFLYCRRKKGVRPIACSLPPSGFEMGRLFEESIAHLMASIRTPAKMRTKRRHWI